MGGHMYPTRRNHGCCVYYDFHLGPTTLNFGKCKAEDPHLLRFVIRQNLVSAMFLQSNLEDAEPIGAPFGDGSWRVCGGHWGGANKDGIFPLFKCEMKVSDFQNARPNFPGCDHEL